MMAGRAKGTGKKRGTGRAVAGVAQKKTKVKGTVLKIVRGKPTNQRLSAAAAFGDLEQAREQVLYAERHGSMEEKRLVRLAFRQYQGMRFRQT